jgi:hypothetical protein
MSNPIPPDEWNERVERRDAEPAHEFPPRPEVVEVTDAEFEERVEGPVRSEGHNPREASPRPAEPRLLPPEEPRQRPMWRRPPGQRDDLGEPTGPGGL